MYVNGLSKIWSICFLNKIQIPIKHTQLCQQNTVTKMFRTFHDWLTKTLWMSKNYSGSVNSKGVRWGELTLRWAMVWCGVVSEMRSGWWPWPWLWLIYTRPQCHPLTTGRRLHAHPIPSHPSSPISRACNVHITPISTCLRSQSVFTGTIERKC